MQHLFDRRFISAQHARRAPIPPDYRFLFDAAEADALTRIGFLKEKPQSVAVHGRRFFDDMDRVFARPARFKFDDHEEVQFVAHAHDTAPFDVVLSLFSLHGINDVGAALGRLRGLLGPRGMLIACVFGPKTLVTLRQALAAAETDLYGKAGPRLYPFAEAPSWAGQLQNAQFVLPVADSEVTRVHYRSLLALLHDVRMMGEASGLVNRTRRPMHRALVQRAEDIYRTLAPDPDGLLAADFEVIWLQGFRG